MWALLWVLASPHKTLGSRCYCFSYFNEQEKETQRDERTCPGPHNFTAKCAERMKGQLFEEKLSRKEEVKTAGPRDEEQQVNLDAHQTHAHS